MKVFLEDYEIENAVRVGVERYNQTKNNTDKSYYDNENKQNELLASMCSAVAECAVAKATNQYWHGGVWLSTQHLLYKDRPDVGLNIEVRRIRKPYNPIPVRKSDVTRGHVVYGVYVEDLEFEEVTIVGYVESEWGWSIGKRPYWDRYDNNRVVEIELLTKLDT